MLLNFAAESPEDAYGYAVISTTPNTPTNSESQC